MFTDRARLPLYIALFAAAIQAVVDRKSGWYGWGFTHPYGDAHLLLSFMFYGAAGWFCVLTIARCYRSALSIHARIACGLVLLSSAAIGVSFAFDSLAGQQTSAHYQGPEHRLAMDVGLGVLGIFAVVGYAVEVFQRRLTRHSSCQDKSETSGKGGDSLK